MTSRLVVHPRPPARATNCTRTMTTHQTHPTRAGAKALAAPVLAGTVISFVFVLLMASAVHAPQPHRLRVAVASPASSDSRLRSGVWDRVRSRPSRRSSLSADNERSGRGFAIGVSGLASRRFPARSLRTLVSLTFAGTVTFAVPQTRRIVEAPLWIALISREDPGPALVHGRSPGEVELSPLHRTRGGVGLGWRRALWPGAERARLRGHRPDSG